MMADGKDRIPVVDFSSCAVKECIDFSSEIVHKCMHGICEAFSRVGFVYLKNFGIPDTQIENVLRKSKSFFDLPSGEKERYARNPVEGFHGYYGFQQESVNPKRPGDLKEAYNVVPQQMKIWPDASVPGFSRDMLGLFESCTKLSATILELMARGLSLKDPYEFTKCHNHTTKPNASALRSLYYPPVAAGNVREGQIRCGEHSDYGSITLLFQDEVGGLEVRNRQGAYVPATPVKGAVLVNIGDLIQRWTSDRLVSTKHRVVVPPGEASLARGRQSLAFFVHPDSDCLIRCLDGTELYEPVNSLDFLQTRFRETY